MTTEPTVHVIDDDESARESLTFLLATADFRVRTYDSGKGVSRYRSRHGGRLRHH
jgi:FixJ family two-component response regulator